MAIPPLRLSRAQLATFLKDAEQIRQFENLLRAVEEIAPVASAEALVSFAPVEAKAEQALALALDLATALVNSTAEAKAQQAIDAAERIAGALDLLAAQAPSVSPVVVSDFAPLPPVPLGTLGQQQADRADITGGTVVAALTDSTTDLIASSQNLSDGAAAALGTLSNAPSAGNPTKWVAIDDNGTTRYIPAW
jgi:hypothetical protein